MKEVTFFFLHAGLMGAIVEVSCGFPRECPLESGEATVALRAASMGYSCGAPASEVRIVKILPPFLRGESGEVRFP
jgi:hypothetical protein